MKIAFILLVQVYGGSSPTYLHQTDSPTGEWACMHSQGDAIWPDSCHYKAILFETRKQLDAWLSHNDATGDKLIDTHNGSVKTLKSTPVTRTTQVPTEVVDHYEVEVNK